MIEQHAPGRGRGLQHADALLFDQGKQGLRVEVDVLPGQHQGCASQQWPIDFQAENIERKGGQRQQPVIGIQARLAGHAAHKVGQGAMAHHHAFGLAGGAGGVDHVGQVFGRGARQRVFAAVAIEPRIRLVQGQGTDPGRDRQARQQRCLGQQQGQAAVLHHVGQAFLGVRRVQWHIGATGLENRQQPDHQVNAALHRNSHQYIRADTGRDQAMGQAVGLLVESGKGQ